MKIKFGDPVRDTVTGYIGVVVARLEWIYETYPKFLVQSHDSSKSNPIFTEWFAEPRLEKITKKMLGIEEESVPKKRGRKPKKETSEVVSRPDEDKPKKRGRKIKRKRESENE